MSDFILKLIEITDGVPLALQLLLTTVWSMIPFIESDLGSFIAVIVGVPVAPAIIVSVIGNIIAVVLLILLVDKIRARIYRDRDPKLSNRQRKVLGRMEKYGVPVTSLLAPTLIGSHLGAFAMASAGADKKKLIIWQIIAITVWGIIFGVTGHLAFLNVTG